MDDQLPPTADARARARALTERANALVAQRRWAEALPLCYQAVEADPSHAVHLHNLGVLLTKMGRLAEGEAIERRAMALAPDMPLIVHALGHNLLAQGRLREAWPLYAARALVPELKTGIPTDFPFPPWKGEPLVGKRLAIFPEQGFGDQLQFVRFLPEVIARGGAITLLTFPALVDLFQANFPQVDVVSAKGAVEFPDPDYWTTLYELPALLDATIETLPQAPYLHASGTWPALGRGFKIGVKLKGNMLHVNDAVRSLPDAEAERLRRALPGIVVSLEPDDSGAANFADTAAIIAQLDLVVSCDTSVAHLAGALGKPCFLLIPGFAPDWRWMWDRIDSPWYASHRLYRGAADGTWTDTVDRLIRDVTNAAAPTRLFAREAIALRDQGRFSEALAAGRKAVAADPHNLVALHNLARLLTDLGRLKEGEAVERRALTVQPDAPALRFGLSMNLLAQGRYHDAWPLYEARTRLSHLNAGFPQDVHFLRWAGENIADKRIAILPEQGFGDQIQFARLLPWLNGRCAEIVLLAPPALVRFFQQAFPGLTVVAAAGTADFPKCDVWTTLSDLPVRADVGFEDLPDGDYARRPAREARHDGYRIGLMTKGNPAYLHDRHRTLPVEAADRLRAGLAGAIVDLDPAVSGAKDFADTAALMADLDLVISVDTAVAHLAGAMGKPCLLLVPRFATDWRWRAGGENNPWYPNHRLFWGEIDGNWDKAVAQVLAHVLQQASRGDVGTSPPLANRSAIPSEGAAEEPGHLAAIARARSESARKPRDFLSALNLGMLLSHIGDLAGGEIEYRRAMALGAGPKQVAAARHGLGLTLLGQGRYAEGFELYRARTMLGAKIGYPVYVPAPHWEGQDISGKNLLVLPEQGIGDQIQFSRFLPRLRDRGAEVRAIVDPALVLLFRESFPDIQSGTDRTHWGAPDYWTTFIDMLGTLRVSSDTIPTGRYLKSPFVWSGTPEGFKVGVKTTGNPNHANDRYRSLSADMAETLHVRLPGMVVNLEQTETGARDFAQTAAAIEQLDLVVSVDTAVAHLAGAMGKPCFLLVPGYATDWRWLRDRDTSPWYPGHFLYRSGIDGDWAAAIERLLHDARALADASATLPL